MDLSFRSFDRAGWCQEEEVVVGDREREPARPSGLLVFLHEAQGILLANMRGHRKVMCHNILLVKETSGKGRLNIFPHLPPSIPRINRTSEAWAQTRVCKSISGRNRPADVRE